MNKKQYKVINFQQEILTGLKLIANTFFANGINFSYLHLINLYNIMPV